MIFGIGTDLVQVGRVQEMLARHGERLPRRILAPPEWADYTAAARPELFLASRFAAKEAFAKAVGTGLVAPVSLGAVGVLRTASGRPTLWVHPDLELWLAQRGVSARHVTLSHDGGFATATVVLESL